MNKCTMCSTLLMLLGLTITASAQTESTADEIVIRIENPIVINPTRSGVGSLGSKYLTNYRIRLPVTPQEGLCLQMPAAEVFREKPHEMSSTDLAFQGAGMGATMGGCVGAFGSSFGWWGDNEAFAITGILSALGAIWTTSKKDEPELRYQFSLGEESK